MHRGDCRGNGPSKEKQWKLNPTPSDELNKLRVDLGANSRGLGVQSPKRDIRVHCGLGR
jgi:hypothetical protein